MWYTIRKFLIGNRFFGMYVLIYQWLRKVSIKQSIQLSTILLISRAISYFFSKIWGTMFACFLFIVASMAIQCHGLPNIDQDSGFILNKILQANLGKS